MLPLDYLYWQYILSTNHSCVMVTVEMCGQLTKRDSDSILKVSNNSKVIFCGIPTNVFRFEIPEAKIR